MWIVKYILLIFLLIGVCSCSKRDKEQSKFSEIEAPITKKQEPKKTTGIDDFIGVWKFKDPYPSEDLVEDHYMIIDMVDSSLVGKYFGTTDDFDDSREGYFPGFFVATMEGLFVDADSIKFRLSILSDQLFKKPVSLDVGPKDQIDLPKWDYGVTYNERDYVGFLTNKGIEFDIYLRRERIFIKQ